MALAVENEAPFASAGAAASHDIAYTSSAGNGLVLFTASRAIDGLSTVTDDAGNTWTQVLTRLQSNAEGEWWVCLDPSPVTTITVTPSISSQLAAHVFEISGHDAAAAIDSTATAHANAATFDVPITTVADDVLLLAGMAKLAAGTATADGTGWTNLLANDTTGSSGVAECCEYEIVSAQGTYDAHWTMDASRGCAVAIIGIKAAAGAAALTLDLGKVASGEQVYGSALAGAGNAALGLGAVATAEAVRGAVLSGAGSATLELGAIAGAAAVRGAVLAGAGSAVLDLGAISSDEAVRGAELAGAGSAVLDLGAVTSGENVYGLDLGGAGTAVLALGLVTSDENVYGIALGAEAAPYFEDTFSGTAGSDAGWPTYLRSTTTGTGAAFTVSSSGNYGRLSVTSATAGARKTVVALRSELASDSVQQADLRDLSLTVSRKQALVARHSGDTATDDRYQLVYEFAAATNRLRLEKVIGGTVTVLAETTDFDTNPTDDLTIKLDCTGTTIQGKAWLSTDAEPATWTLTATDSALDQGYDGLLMDAPDSQTTIGDFDNYKLITLTQIESVTLALGKIASAAAVSGIDLSGTGSATLDLGAIASGESVYGTDLAPSGSATLDLGHIASAATVYGIDLLAGTLILNLGKVSSASAVRGATLSGSGNATLELGAIPSEEAVRGADLSGSGSVSLLLGFVPGDAAVRGVVLDGSGSAVLDLGIIASGEAVRGIELALGGANVPGEVVLSIVAASIAMDAVAPAVALSVLAAGLSLSTAYAAVTLLLNAAEAALSETIE